MNKIRYGLLDSIRGFALINMIIYHALWDVVYMFGVDIKWYYSKPGFIWQQFICHTFIFLSGFCFSMGKNKLKRGLTVFASSIIICAVTLLFMPDSRILFGVLCLIGSCMLILIPFENIIKKINPYIGFIIFMTIFVLTKNIPDKSWEFGNLFTAYVGFPHGSFRSVDYFPLIPWLFLYVGGFYMYIIFKKHNLLKIFYGTTIKPLEFMGRHSLVIYMLHQPVIYGVLLMIFEVI